MSTAASNELPINLMLNKCVSALSYCDMNELFQTLSNNAHLLFLAFSSKLFTSLLNSFKTSHSLRNCGLSHCGFYSQNVGLVTGSTIGLQVNIRGLLPNPSTQA